MNVALLSIGDEVLAGRIVDSNSAWLAAQLSSRGVRVIEQSTVGDDRLAIAEAIRRLSQSAELVIATGGLGPTPDDLTRQSVADLSDAGKLDIDDRAMEQLRAWCLETGLPLTEARVEVVKRPPSAISLDNSCGTASGLRVSIEDADCWLLPGPPEEMRSMAERHLLPVIEKVLGRAPVQEIRVAGLTEVQVAELLGSRLDRSLRPRLGIRVGTGLVRVVIEDVDGDQDSGRLDDAAASLRELLHPWSLPADASTLAETVGEAFSQQGASIITAESCTGGLIGGALTSIPGSSSWYRGGWVTYTNAMKTSSLMVPPSCFEQDGQGAVSEKVVKAMAEGARSQSGATVAMAVSGIAGPGGGSEEKPVGTVWLGLADADGVQARLTCMPGDRARIRARTVDAALLWMWWWSQQIDARLPWEISP